MIPEALMTLEKGGLADLEMARKQCPAGRFAFVLVG